MKQISGDQLSSSRRRSDVPVVTLAPSEQLAIDLPSYLSAGYGWSLAAEPARLEVVEHTTSPAPDNALGGGNERFIIVSNPGEGIVDVVIRLMAPYARRAEKTLFLRIDNPPKRRSAHPSP